MTDKRKEGLRQRLERVWTKRRPDSETGTELTAEGMETRTPTPGEFFDNLDKVSSDEPGEKLSHPRRDQNGD